jgi:hypothetical protein
MSLASPGDRPSGSDQFDCVADFGAGMLTLSALHIPWMAKKSHPRLLEVTVVPLEPTRWEWRVYEGDTPLMTGFETSRETAQIEGDRALFRLLSAGSDK